MQQLIKLKKDEARNVGSGTLNPKLPFGEIDMERIRICSGDSWVLSMSRS
jgi:hypothetical protein